MAGNQNYQNRFLAGSYLYAADNHDQLYSEYTRGHALYVASRILSFSFWGLGGAALTAAFLFDDERQPIAAGLWNRILMTAGMALLAAGSSSHMLAFNTLDALEELRRAYLEETVDFDSKYNAYQQAYTRYTAFTYLSYGLWALGGAAVITSLFVPFGTGTVSQTENDIAALSIVPLPGGIHLNLTLHPKGRF